MVKLDVTLLRYLTKDDFRVLTSVEMGMKNHELVSAVLIRNIASLKNANSSKILQQLTQHKLVSYERGKRYDGYRLTYLGYDYLALNVLANRNVIANVGNQIGVGKESDVYVGTNDQHQRYIIKLHRLGRTCFRKVTLKRDYLKSGNKTNWIYLSRLAALREFAFMKVLHEKGLPVPEPIDCNRHCIVMQFIDGTLLNQMSKDDINDIPSLYDKLMNLIITLANDYGLVHGDFNEFNILITNDSNEPILIDFPQMLSVSHPTAQTYFERDVDCIVNFFAKKFSYESDQIPCFESFNFEDEKLNDFKSLVKDSIKNEDESNFDDFLVNQIENFELNQDDEEEINEENEENEENEQDLNESKDISKEDELNSKLETLNMKNDSEDNSSEMSFGHGTASIASTFTPDQIKLKLKRERIKREKRQAIKKASKGAKGNSSAVIRKRKEDIAIVNDDLKTYKLDKF